MPGMRNRREAIRNGQDWTKSKSGYMGGGEVMPGYKHGGGVMKSKGYKAGGKVRGELTSPRYEGDGKPRRITKKKTPQESRVRTKPGR